MARPSMRCASSSTPRRSRRAPSASTRSRTPSPGANTVEVAGRVRTVMASLKQFLPASVDLQLRSDLSESIRASLADVRFTLFLTLALVVLVIFLFLRNLSATVIPSLALPFSLVGTFAVMYALDYSLDNLSMMALTLSVGFVVDDAIVMLENI